MLLLSCEVSGIVSNRIWLEWPTVVLKTNVSCLGIRQIAFKLYSGAMREVKLRPLKWGYQKFYGQTATRGLFHINSWKWGRFWYLLLCISHGTEKMSSPPSGRKMWRLLHHDTLLDLYSSRGIPCIFFNLNLPSNSTSIWIFIYLIRFAFNTWSVFIQ